MVACIEAEALQWREQTIIDLEAGLNCLR